MDKIAIGIDLGGTTIKFAFVNEKGEIVVDWSTRTPTHEGGQHVLPKICSSIKMKMREHGLSTSDFVGVGMGSPGAVNREKGTVTGAYNLNWSETVRVREQIESSLGIPLFFDNDANVAALGEQWMGAAKDEPNVVFLTLGTGVGGGVIVDGQLVHGSKDTAGEIGHIKVEEDGFACTCGRMGCLETVASATGIVNVARQEAKDYIEISPLAQGIMHGQTITAKFVFDNIKLKDPLAEAVLTRVGKYLGTACANIANILNPSTIVIGGGVSKAGDELLRFIVPFFEQTAFPTIAADTAIRIASLENTAGVLGAASLVFKETPLSK
ncbi:ROK family glucokinase [Alkalibacterium sp.]|nr:MAG: ROK family protein [Alkalibacterium sp.]